MFTQTIRVFRPALLGIGLLAAAPLGAQHAGHPTPQPVASPAAPASQTKESTRGPRPGMTKPQTHSSQAYDSLTHRAHDSLASQTPQLPHPHDSVTQQKAHIHDSVAQPTSHSAGHSMWMKSLGRGWNLMGMAQVFPTVSTATAGRQETLLTSSGVYATQPAIMANLASHGGRLVLRTTLNFEAWTQPKGELTYGGWGEGFIDSRHPHTLLHEAILTANWWDVGGGALSISAGKGFAPYGTDDPMARPAVKYPTNHHLSQALERWTTNVAYLRNGWSLEAGVFGGTEPNGPYDMRNIESFGDSWSARVAKRFGEGFGPAAPWEVSASHASIVESHHGAKATTRLYNTAVRHAQAHRLASVYSLLEGSVSDPDQGKGHFSVLGEMELGVGRARQHAPYARVEFATRPEYARLGAPGTPDFFRYDHSAHEIGATRWLTSTVGYGYTASSGGVSIRPYAELQHNVVTAERGGIDPRDLYGERSFWSLSVGARVFLGGGQMRMGSYGTLDPMTAAMRPREGSAVMKGEGH